MAKKIGSDNQIDMPDEDFLKYVPGTGIAATHSGGEKQSGQHILLCVFCEKLD